MKITLETTEGAVRLRAFEPADLFKSGDNDERLNIVVEAANVLDAVHALVVRFKDLQEQAIDALLACGLINSVQTVPEVLPS